jgi:hypothetical protein
VVDDRTTRLGEFEIREDDETGRESTQQITDLRSRDAVAFPVLGAVAVGDRRN